MFIKYKHLDSYVCVVACAANIISIDVKVAFFPPF